MKRFERDGNHFLQVCKQLSALAPKKPEEFDPHLTFMRETLGIMQHHDAITGTEKEKVALDYAKRMSVAFRACGATTRNALNQLTVQSKDNVKDTSAKYVFEFKTCALLNITSCPVSEANDRFALTLYNPLAHTVNEYVRIPVPYSNYRIIDNKGMLHRKSWKRFSVNRLSLLSGVTLESQAVPIPQVLIDIKHRNSTAKYEIVFLATNIPALGYRTYYVEKLDSTEGNTRSKALPKRTSSVTVIGNSVRY